MNRFLESGVYNRATNHIVSLARFVTELIRYLSNRGEDSLIMQLVDCGWKTVKRLLEERGLRVAVMAGVGSCILDLCGPGSFPMNTTIDLELLPWVGPWLPRSGGHVSGRAEYMTEVHTTRRQRKGYWDG